MFPFFTPICNRYGPSLYYGNPPVKAFFWVLRVALIDSTVVLFRFHRGGEGLMTTLRHLEPTTVKTGCYRMYYIMKVLKIDYSVFLKVHYDLSTLQPSVRPQRERHVSVCPEASLWRGRQCDSPGVRLYAGREHCPWTCA